MSLEATWDVIVVGGGPAGATAAAEIAQRGWRVLLLDRDGRIKPCGGAVPPKLMEEFAIPDELLVARIDSAAMISPAGRRVLMPIEGGYVGMVDREVFDAWLRRRAAARGAELRVAHCEGFERDADGTAVVLARLDGDEHARRFRGRLVIAADGARSRLARATIPGAERVACVFAYHEIVSAPQPAQALTGSDGECAVTAGDSDPLRPYAPNRCDVYYRGRMSPDFYGWVFPHGQRISVGVGSARQGFSLRTAVGLVRDDAGLAGAQTLRREGAPIPMRPLRRWDNGRDVLVAGDAAGVVAPASGEGIYYAMYSGRLAADAAVDFLRHGEARALRAPRRRFMRAHGRVFFVLGILQRFWYSSDRRREKFVEICRDPDVQYLTWQAYMHKRLVRARPLAHLRIFWKDLMHLFGSATT